MTCDHFRELISAAIDGEIDGGETKALDAHLATCTSCRAFSEASWSLRRSLRVAAAPESQTVEIEVATGAPIGSRAVADTLRVALFVIGGVLVALNAPAIISGGDPATTHLGRHDGIFGTALGLAMIAVAARPQRAIGLVPLTSAIAALMTVAAIADLAAGRASLMSEAIHVVEIAGLISLWIISGGPTRLRRRAATLTRFRRAGTPAAITAV